MQKKETAIEVKVGALVLFAIGLLVAFVLVLGDFSFNDGFDFYVEFENAGGLKPGGDVAIAGLNVGKVESLQFRRNTKNPKMNVVVVRAKVTIDEEYADSVRTSSEFFITTRGVLGEPYIEIVTQTFDAPKIAAGDVRRGVDPPRMDIIVAKGTQLLTVLTDLLNDPEIEIKDLLSNTSALVKTINDVVVGNRKDIDGTISGARKSADEAAKLLAALNVAIEDGESLKQTLSQTSSVVRKLDRTASVAYKVATDADRKLGPALDNISGAANSVREISDSAKGIVKGNEAKIQTSINNIAKATDDVAVITQKSKSLVTKVERGEGTVGQLITDREVYDDLKELMRQVKRKPWKILWKE